MRLTDFYDLVHTTTSDRAFGEARRRGFALPDTLLAMMLIVARSTLNLKLLTQTLRDMRQDSEFDGFLRALMCMELADTRLDVEDVEAKSYRAEALRYAKTMQPGRDQRLVLDWIWCKNARRGGMKRINWKRYESSLDCLIASKHYDLVDLGLFFVQGMLGDSQLDRADRMLDRILECMRQGVPHTSIDVELAGRLVADVSRLKARRRARQKK